MLQGKSVTVVIPTYNRADILCKTLQGYAEQCGDHRILEVLVVDDGSTDHTAGAVDKFATNSALPVRRLYQQNSGLAAARNHAIREASGQLMLFADDDIIPARTMLAQHTAWHARYPDPSVGILGHVSWAPEVRATPFMDWAGLFGPQFQFGYLTHDSEIEFQHAYFCNTSLKRSILTSDTYFDERFRGYGWEDIELSYRLYGRGWRVRYNREAIGYHYKYETFEDSLRRTEKVYRAWPLFLDTGAGQYLSGVWRSERAASAGRRKSALSALLGHVKLATVPLLRRLMDSRLSLPAKVYDAVWYHYSKPISDAAIQGEKWPA